MDRNETEWDKIKQMKTKMELNTKIPYSNLFNFSFKSSNIPNDLKCANVPIYKSGERSDPNNYNLISLLSITSKVMESIINDYVKKHLYGSSLITKHQFGFRSNHSTFDLLTSATQQ